MDIGRWMENKIDAKYDQIELEGNQKVKEIQQEILRMQGLLDDPLTNSEIYNRLCLKMEERIEVHGIDKLKAYKLRYIIIIIVVITTMYISKGEIASACLGIVMNLIGEFQEDRRKKEVRKQNARLRDGQTTYTIKPKRYKDLDYKPQREKVILKEIRRFKTPVGEWKDEYIMLTQRQDVFYVRTYYKDDFNEVRIEDPIVIIEWGGIKLDKGYSLKEAEAILKTSLNGDENRPADLPYCAYSLRDYSK